MHDAQMDAGTLVAQERLMAELTTKAQLILELPCCCSQESTLNKRRLLEKLPRVKAIGAPRRAGARWQGAGWLGRR